MPASLADIKRDRPLYLSHITDPIPTKVSRQGYPEKVLTSMYLESILSVGTYQEVGSDGRTGAAGNADRRNDEAPPWESRMGGSFPVGERQYRVVPKGPGLIGLRCSCPDFELRGLPCKHVIAVEIVVRRETPEGDVLTETVRVTYSQDWTAYNRGQCEEGERFPAMLADLCATLPTPAQGRGRPRLPMSDMAFACVSRFLRVCPLGVSTVRSARPKPMA